jgi:hypothetical protein
MYDRLILPKKRSASSGFAIGHGEGRLGQPEARLMLRLGALVKQYVADKSGVSKELASVAPEFLAALTANESGGNPNAKRFEPAVYRHLKDVAAGRVVAYGAITKPLIAKDIERAEGTESHPSSGSAAQESAPAGKAGAQAGARETLPAKAEEYHAVHLTAVFADESGKAAANLQDDAIRDLATSWGLTQIMGYHMLGRPEPVAMLREPEFHYRMAAELIHTFAVRFHLNAQRDFEALFRCWNTGRPDGITYDPAYVQKGLRRAALARQLTAEAAASEAVAAAAASETAGQQPSEQAPAAGAENAGRGAEGRGGEQPGGYRIVKGGAKRTEHGEGCGFGIEATGVQFEVLKFEV